MGLWRELRGWMGLLGRDSRFRSCANSKCLFVKTLDMRYKLVESLSSGSGWVRHLQHWC